MKKVIKFNTGYLVDIAGLVFIGFALCAFCSHKKGFAIASIISGVVTLICAALYLIWQDTAISNNSDTSVSTKPEEGDEPNEVKPNETLYGLDGVKLKGRVYKLVDGTHATVTETGEIKIHSVFGNITNTMLGGGELSVPPDKGWQKLFEKQQ